MADDIGTINPSWVIADLKPAAGGDELINADWGRKIADNTGFLASKKTLVHSSIPNLQSIQVGLGITTDTANFTFYLDDNINKLTIDIYDEFDETTDANGTTTLILDGTTVFQQTFISDTARTLRGTELTTIDFTTGNDARIIGEIVTRAGNDSTTTFHSLSIWGHSN